MVNTCFSSFFIFHVLGARVGGRPAGRPLPARCFFDLSQREGGSDLCGVKRHQEGPVLAHVRVHVHGLLFGERERDDFSVHVPQQGQEVVGIDGESEFRTVQHGRDFVRV